MPSSPCLVLVAPGIGVTLPHVPVPALARLAGRGKVVYQWSREEPDTALLAWQRGLLEVLGIAASNVASAAFSVENASSSYWLHAEPAHFVAGLDRLTFLPLTGEARVTHDERAAVFATLSPGFSSGDLVLVGSGHEWFLRSDRPLQLTTSTPEAAASNELQRAMPRGPDASPVRRAMTEMQMLLHEHPVNEARARRGLPAVNAVWLWGGGMRVPMKHALPPAFGSSAFLRGLYGACQQSVAPLPGDPDSLVAAIRPHARAIAVVEDFDAGWLSGLARTLAQGQLSRLELILDSWHVVVNRADLLRFWRRDLPADRWEQRA